jgi:NUMOD3 motif-containing protein
LLIRQASIGRPKTAEELAKISAANRGENNHLYGKHHTDASKRKSVETKIRNGTLGRFPEKTIALSRIVKELDDAGVDKVKIASLAIKQMRENGMKMSKVHAYRVLPQEYKQEYSCSSSKKRDRKAKLKALGLQITRSSATKQCIEKERKITLSV